MRSEAFKCFPISSKFNYLDEIGELIWIDEADVNEMQKRLKSLEAKMEMKNCLIKL
jgi:hypothetical protein